MTLAKKLKTHGKWTIVWIATSEAYTYVFPHCCKELLKYGKHIQQFFAAYPVLQHKHIFYFNTAVRQRESLLNETCYSLTSPSLKISESIGCTAPWHLLKQELVGPSNTGEEEEVYRRHVSDGMKGTALWVLQEHAYTLISVTDVTANNTQGPIAWLNRSKLPGVEQWSDCSKYAQDFWVKNKSEHMPTPDYSLMALALPSPPDNELCNMTAWSTIHFNPNLFHIVTPINVNTLHYYLVHHSNQPLVFSALGGLYNGFWPWADTSGPDVPIIFDQPAHPLQEDIHHQFVYKQCDVEIKHSHFLEAFEENLLSGIYSVPVGVVPKPHTDRKKFRLVVDHSIEQFSLNSFIAREDAKTCLDTLHQLSKALVDTKWQYPLI